jgi:hypothetical protein
METERPGLPRRFAGIVLDRSIGTKIVASVLDIAAVFVAGDSQVTVTSKDARSSMERCSWTGTGCWNGWPTRLPGSVPAAAMAWRLTAAKSAT